MCAGGIAGKLGFYGCTYGCEGHADLSRSRMSFPSGSGFFFSEIPRIVLQSSQGEDRPVSAKPCKRTRKCLLFILLSVSLSPHVFGVWKLIYPANPREAAHKTTRALLINIVVTVCVGEQGS